MDQPVKFYQTGTFTVGNRLLAPEQRTVQASIERSNSLNSGHRACQGCGEALGARYAIDAVGSPPRAPLGGRVDAAEARGLGYKLAAVRGSAVRAAALASVEPDERTEAAHLARGDGWRGWS